jgi:predicted transposase YbfD/YdcC
LGLFKEGLPVHNTIARLISRIDPSVLQSTFTRWMQEVVKLSEGEVVAVDGKCLRSSYNRQNRQSVIHMLSAFATANGVVIGQTKTDAKSNAITAIADLPKSAGNKRLSYHH